MFDPNNPTLMTPGVGIFDERRSWTGAARAELRG